MRDTFESQSYCSKNMEGQSFGNIDLGNILAFRSIKIKEILKYLGFIVHHFRISTLGFGTELCPYMK